MVMVDDGVASERVKRLVHDIEHGNFKWDDQTIKSVRTVDDYFGRDASWWDKDELTERERSYLDIASQERQ